MSTFILVQATAAATCKLVPPQKSKKVHLAVLLRTHMAVVVTTCSMHESLPANM
jgi:hypothetical protein